MTDFETIGKQNKTRGDTFEDLVANRAKHLDTILMVKRIDRVRRRGTSLPDIEFIDFPELMVDCKFTEGIFSIKEKKKLLEECQCKYGAKNAVPIVVCGEKKDKIRLITEDVLVCFQSPMGMFLMTPLDDWLLHLHDVKVNRLKKKKG